MNINSIKNRAREVLMTNKVQYMRVLIIVLVINCIPSLINGESTIMSLLHFVLLILCFPVSHGIIVASLKMVRNNASFVNDEDGLVGFKRFGELFPTYFTVDFIEFLIVFVIAFVFGLVIVGMYGTSLMNIAYFYDSPEAILNYVLNTEVGLLAVIFIFLIIIIVIALILNALLFAVPYLLEQYHITGFNACKTSYNMMKGHIKDYLKLFFSFFGWIFLMYIIEALISSFIAIDLITSLIVGLLRIVTYLPLYSLSETVLFEEIAFYYFGGE